MVGNCGAVRGRVSFVEWRDSLHIPHIGWKVRGVSLNASDEVSFYSSLLSTLDIAAAILRTQPYRCPDPVWPGEDHATLDHLGLYGRAGCCQSPQGSSPNDEGTGLPPHLRARLALLPCHRPIFLPLDPHDVRSKGCKASCALEDEESVEPGVKHDRILVEGGPQGDLAKRLSRNQPCVESGIWTPAAKSRLT